MSNVLCNISLVETRLFSIVQRRLFLPETLRNNVIESEKFANKIIDVRSSRCSVVLFNTRPYFHTYRSLRKFSGVFTDLEVSSIFFVSLSRRQIAFITIMNTAATAITTDTCKIMWFREIVIYFVLSFTKAILFGRETIDVRANSQFRPNRIKNNKFRVMRFSKF